MRAHTSKFAHAPQACEGYLRERRWAANWEVCYMRIRVHVNIHIVRRHIKVRTVSVTRYSPSSPSSSARWRFVPDGSGSIRNTAYTTVRSRSVQNNNLRLQILFKWYVQDLSPTAGAASAPTNSSEAEYTAIPGIQRAWKPSESLVVRNGSCV